MKVLKRQINECTFIKSKTTYNHKYLMKNYEIEEVRSYLLEQLIKFFKWLFLLVKHFFDLHTKKKIRYESAYSL